MRSTIALTSLAEAAWSSASTTSSAVAMLSSSSGPRLGEPDTIAPVMRTSATVSPRGLGRDGSLAYSASVTRVRLLPARVVTSSSASAR
jgi:hypothetical protein